MTKDRTRWEYKHLVLNFDVTSMQGGGSCSLRVAKAGRQLA